MSFVQRTFHQCRRNPLLKSLAAYGAAELSVRLVRLAVVVVIARVLEPEIVGVAALTLTLFELTRVLANIGVGQRIIAADPSELAALCNTAHRVFWVWCSVVATAQLLAAAVLAFGFGQIVAGQMLAVLALVYPLMPGGLVQCFLLMREGRAAMTARTAAIQTISDHLLTAALLLLWPSPWAIVLPKLLTAPIWLLLTRRARPWVTEPAAGYAPWRGLVRFGLSVLATDLMLAMRNQLDKIIVAATLGVSALGTYFFAFNAGIGILSSLISAFGTVALPWLCGEPEGPRRVQRLRSVIILGCGLFVPIVLLQAALAPIYVPIVFGQNWIHASGLVAILSLAGIPMLLTAIATAWLRASQTPGIDAKAGLIGCSAALGGLYLGAQTGALDAAAGGWLIGLSLGTLPFACAILGRASRIPSNQFSKEIAI